MKKVSLLILGGAFILFLIGCTGGHLTVDESYSVLKPVKQLELPEQVSENLVITISNVADEGSSYKNHIDLMVNDRLIKPNWSVSNVEKAYTYKLRLRPGYYEVKAKYYAYVGWGEDKYSITTNELVRVSSDRRTVLTCEIIKEASGAPVNSKMYFKVSSEPFEVTQSVPTLPRKPLEIAVRPVLPEKPLVAPKLVTEILEVPPVEAIGKESTVFLQINSIPEQAEVVVDDKFVGQSPLRVLVDRNVDHVVRISAPGYKNATKVLDHSLFGQEKAVHLIHELELVK